MKIENEFQGFDSPHKTQTSHGRMPSELFRSHGERSSGAVAVEGGKWEIYIGGAAGSSVRKGDIFCAVDSHEDVLIYMGRFHSVLPRDMPSTSSELTDSYKTGDRQDSRHREWKTAKESASGWIGK